MKGSLSTAVTAGLIILSMIFIVILLFSTAELTAESYASATLQISKFSVFHKIMTSRNCVSTGETGILNKTLLDDANNGGELECAYLPDCAHYVRVDNLNNGESWDWKFGYKGDGDWQDYMETYVSIMDGSDVIPGFVSMKINCKDPVINEEEDNFIICLTAAAERAWITGELEKKCNMGSEIMADKLIDVDFDPDKICLKDSGGVIECRDFYRAVADDVTKQKGSQKDMCTVKYVKVGTELIIDEFECEKGKFNGLDGVD